MDNIKVVNNYLYLSCSLLREEYKISIKTIECWKRRQIGKRLIHQGNVYIAYDTIPAPTRAKLPSKEDLLSRMKAAEHDAVTERYYRRMENAYLKGFIKYRDIYRNAGVEFDDIIKYAQHHAVWAVILEIHKEQARPKLRNIWEAYCRIYPGKYAYNRMNPCINQCKTGGIESLLIKKYHTIREKKYNPVYDKWVLDALSSGKAYAKAEIHRLVCSLCKERNYPEPSLGWVKYKCRELEPLVNASRYGADNDTYKKLPYKGIIRAEHANDQWQIDGWRLPFYMNGYKTLTLFWVLDAHSGKAIGYEIAPTEHTETILKGLEDAVSNAGCLPFEILSDNHSFNKTEEAGYFKDAVSKLGTTWTVSENPRYKSLVERSFKTFGEMFCKKQYGYIGEGIRTRNKNGRTSQELLDRYTKAETFLTEEQIKLIAINCIEEYNNRKGKDGKTRNERYAESAKAIEIDKTDYLRLFIRETEITIRRGQVDLQRGGIKYEYALTAEQFKTLNDKKVRVRYESFDEVYLFDLETDEFIGTVKRKEYAHGALANQTEDDTKQFFKHKGRLSGIKSDRKKSQIEIARLAESIDPEAAYAMNAKLTPKNIIEEFETNGRLRAEAERRGINLSEVTNIKTFSEVRTYNPEPKGKKTKSKEHPFSVSEKEKAAFNINDYLIED